VSRVTSGADKVSGKTKTKVLAAVSRLQYTPNALAVELGRGKGVNPRKRGILVPALAGTKAKLPFYSGADAQNERRQTGRARLLKDEYSRVRRLVVNLSKDLEKLRSIIQ
jgi:DNA-binding LacI/PurR family transcriptional regulator